MDSGLTQRYLCFAASEDNRDSKGEELLITSSFHITKVWVDGLEGNIFPDRDPSLFLLCPVSSSWPFSEIF